MGKQWKQWDFIFLGSKITADGDCSHEIKSHLLPEEKLWSTWQHIKKQKHYSANKDLSSQSYSFSSSHVWMWELGYKESWVLKNWCFWTVVLEKTLESPLDSKEIHQLIPKEISPEYSLEGLMLKLKLQCFGHLRWGCGREARHAGSGPNHLHMSLLGRRVLGNLRLSHTF